MEVVQCFSTLHLGQSPLYLLSVEFDGLAVAEVLPFALQYVVLVRVAVTPQLPDDHPEYVG